MATVGVKGLALLPNAAKQRGNIWESQSV